MNTMLVVLPIALSFVILTVKGLVTEMANRTPWYRRLFGGDKPDLAQERLFRERLAAMRPLESTIQRVKGDRQLVLSHHGTMASRLAPSLLESLGAGNVDSFIGPNLLDELSKSDRDACLADMPPWIKDRLTVVHAPLVPGGLGGLSIPQALAIKDRWLSDETDAAERWCEAILHNWAEHKVGPLLHEAIISTGGSLAPARVALEAFAARFPGVPQYVFAALDRKDIVRKRWDDVYEYLGADSGLVRGFVLNDSARDQQRNDWGNVHLPTALLAGSWLSQDTLGPLNALGYVFPENDPGRIAMISVEAKTIPVACRTAFAKHLGTLWYSEPSVIIDTMLQGIKEIVTNENLQSLGLKKVGKGNTRVLTVIAPLDPVTWLPHVQETEARIRPWLRQVDRNIVLQFASVGQRFNATRMSGVITFILLQRIAGGADDVSNYVAKTLDGPSTKPTLALQNGKAGHKRLTGPTHQREDKPSSTRLPAKTSKGAKK